jgi:hypothetical protein
MSNLSEREIQLYTGGNFSLLKDYLDKKTVKSAPWVNTQTVTPSSAAYSLIPSSVLAGALAIGTSSTQSNGGVMCAALAGAVGTAATTIISDSYGNILNLVDIRDSSTNDPIVDSSNRKVWGLLQAASSATDGDAIAAAASENLQISFVVFGAAYTLSTTTLNQAIDFHINKLYSERYLPTLIKEGGNRDVDIISGTQSQIIGYWTVTTAFAANEVITLSTGAGAAAGISTPDGATILLPISAALFNADGRVIVSTNGRINHKGTGKDVIWNSTNSLHFSRILEIGEEIMIIAPSNYG